MLEYTAWIGLSFLVDAGKLGFLRSPSESEDDPPPRRRPKHTVSTRVSEARKEQDTHLDWGMFAHALGRILCVPVRPRTIAVDLRAMLRGLDQGTTAATCHRQRAWRSGSI